MLRDTHILYQLLGQDITRAEEDLARNESSNWLTPLVTYRGGRALRKDWPSRQDCTVPVKHQTSVLDLKLVILTKLT